MELILFSISVTLATTSVLLAVNLYLYQQYQENFIGLWSAGWALYVLRLIFELGLVSAPAMPYLFSANQFFSLLSGIFLAWGTDVFGRHERKRVWIGLSIAGVLWIVAGNYLPLPSSLLYMPIFIFLGLVNLWVGGTMLTYPIAGVGKIIAGCTFIAWGLHKLNYPFLRDVTWFATWGYLLGAILALTAALGMLIMSFEKEIAERKAAESQVRQLIYFDSLTGLPNRTSLKKRLKEELEKVSRGQAGGAVLFIDLDDLKLVNDTFGHTCGDEVIIKAGSYIFAEAAAAGVVARIGDDEFIVLLLNKTDRQEITAITKRISQAITRDYTLSGTSIRISASIGVAVYPEDGDQAEDLFKKADLALYAAKESGKNSWRFYEESMQQDACENMSIQHNLRYAIERGELALHYQPIVSLPDRDIISFEALLRWTSPEHGTVPPDRFIKLAEQSDLIHLLGQWVLREACKFARNMTDLGLGQISVSVNISPRQLEARDFVSLVRRSIESAAIQPSQLELEVTENVLIHSMEDSIRKLQELKVYGVRLSLDDFGVGYSSLTYLKNLPIKKLKIDKSFIDKILSDDAQFAGAIIHMAHSLGLVVVAEGVETERQAAELFKYRCDYIQGYLLSRPVPREQAIGLITAFRR